MIKNIFGLIKWFIVGKFRGMVHKDLYYNFKPFLHRKEDLWRNISCVNLVGFVVIFYLKNTFF